MIAEIGQSRDLYLLTFKSGVVGDGKPESIAQNGAAQTKAGIILAVISFGRFDHGLTWFAGNPVVGKKAERLTVKFIAAGIGDHIDGASQGAAIFRLITACYDLYLLDKIVGQISAGEIAKGIGHIHAVNGVFVLESGCPRHIEAIAQVAGVHLGQQRSHAAIVALNRQLGNSLR
ncbi:MAG: hypothetical protein BWY83_01657 [bacterium ADurb.Bin478]|nr:MAG: hypothetical protein BWY83_01657 [bacterium ADurb.Bin478]